MVLRRRSGAVADGRILGGDVCRHGRGARRARPALSGRRTAGGVRPRHTSTRVSRGTAAVLARAAHQVARDRAHGFCKAGSSPRIARGSPKPAESVRAEACRCSRPASASPHGGGSAWLRGAGTQLEIGESLYVSAKTASVHVTNILREACAPSRFREAAATSRSGSQKLSRRAIGVPSGGRGGRASDLGAATHEVSSGAILPAPPQTASIAGMTV